MHSSKEILLHKTSLSDHQSLQVGVQSVNRGLRENASNIFHYDIISSSKNENIIYPPLCILHQQKQKKFALSYKMKADNCTF